MRRAVRNYIAAACFALCIASFPSHLWLFFKYHSSLPNVPQPQLGRVHQSSNHGSFVYLTDKEATGQSFLTLAFLAGFLLGFAIVPKRQIPGKGIEHDLVNPSRKQTMVFLISIALYLAIIIFAGQRIVGLAVSHGVVVDF